MDCMHEPCTCRDLTEDGFCSEPCRMGTGVGPFCSCGHADCEASPVG